MRESSYTAFNAS